MDAVTKSIYFYLWKYYGFIGVAIKRKLLVVGTDDGLIRVTENGGDNLD